MKKVSISWIGNILLILLQSSGILLAVILEYFSTRRMGVGRYLVYKEQVFETTVFTPVWLNVYNSLCIAGIILFIFILIFKAAGSRKKIIHLVVAVIVNFIGFLFITFQTSIMLNAYYFFLIGILFVILLQYLKLLSFFWKRHH